MYRQKDVPFCCKYTGARSQKHNTPKYLKSNAKLQSGFKRMSMYCDGFPS